MKEFQRFLLAIQNYTRIPVSKWIKYDADNEVKSLMYLPLVGIIVGAISGGVYLVTQLIFPVSISLIFSMIASVLVTGAFHEDGLADTCDGFGGGWSKDKILEIMKDSRIGVFGAVGLITILLLKFFVLYELKEIVTIFNTGWKFSGNYLNEKYFILLVMISAHSLSRFIALTGIISHSYARNQNQQSKMNTLSQSQLSKIRMALAGILGLSPLFLFFNPYVILIFPVLFIVRWLMSRFFNKWIGGYTGDCLGAIQQVTEVVFYLMLYAVVNVEL